MAKLNFAKPYYNVALSANMVATEEAYNVYFEAMPQGGFAIRRRPGLELIHDGGTAVSGTGIHWSEKRDKLFYTIGGVLYGKAEINTAPIAIGEVHRLGLPTVFAESQELNLDSVLYVATGSTLQYIEDDEAAVLTPTDASTPSSTFICNLNNRLFANDTTAAQDFWITDVNPGTLLEDPLYWSSANNPFRATQKPDRLMGIYSGWDEIYLWGSQACEVWQEDGVTPVSPLVGSLIEAGLIAPYSVAVANNKWIALCKVGGNVAVISVSGRTPEILSEPIANHLQEMSSYADAIGSLCFTGGLSLYILSFPSENKTWVYDFKSDVWSQWTSYNAATAAQNAFIGRFGAYAATWNTHVVLSNTGDLYKIDRSLYSDAGTAIRSSIRTGWIDHGTWDRKRSDQLIIKVQGYASSDAKILMRWRSDGFPEWSTAIELPIQWNKQNDHFVKLSRMGMYRSRQYEFIMTDAADMALTGMDEDVTKMRN